jgi:hypothetical protein
VFCCVPSRAGLPGTETADSAARDAAAHEILQSERALSSDICVQHCHPVLSSSQDEWTATPINKLQTVKPSVEVWHSSIRKEGPACTPLKSAHSPDT